MEMIVCPHCGSLQRQTADLGAQLQCESCYKPFIVAPEEAEAPAPAPAFSGATPVAPGNIAHRRCIHPWRSGRGWRFWQPLQERSAGRQYRAGRGLAARDCGYSDHSDELYRAQLRICRHPDYRHCCIGGRHGGRAAGTRLPRRDAHRRLQPDAAGKTLQ